MRDRTDRNIENYRNAMQREDRDRARYLLRVAFYHTAHSPGAALSEFERLLALAQPGNWLLQEGRLRRIPIDQARVLAYNELARLMPSVERDAPARALEPTPAQVGQLSALAHRHAADMHRRAEAARRCARPGPACPGAAAPAGPRVSDPRIDSAPDPVRQARDAIRSLMPVIAGLHAMLRAARSNPERRGILQRLAPHVAARARHWQTLDAWFETIGPPPAREPLTNP